MHDNFNPIKDKAESLNCCNKKREELIRFSTSFVFFQNLGLTPAYVVIRGFHLFIAGVMRIGRIDTPIISERAAYLGPIELDAYPRIFRKDILVQ
jgi:hypothetical protein